MSNSGGRVDSSTAQKSPPSHTAGPQSTFLIAPGVPFLAKHRSAKINDPLDGGVAVNNGEQKQAEEARSWLAAIVESSDCAVVGTTPEGVITSWNSGAQKLYGYTPQEAIGHSISVLIPPDRPEEMPRILERIERGERLDRYETVHACNNGGQNVMVVRSSRAQP